ncbi:PilZ domain-containing protein [Marinobacter sp. X15-166B]|uniref:PilZ domain-containing protein n=1 Tax=Marinobacter sp. X15-166B TaxID=1897620 RepID=UPI00085BBF12|nr:PilZ domain-containing protein [Marinobacter sp. X15-166B]OEY67140.1 pilus assembly protein PilZ [Marinobacter sp. X15-166B]
MKDYTEKRSFYRMRVNSEITLTDKHGYTRTGICRDLSGTGMQLQVSRAFAEGTELHTSLPAASDQFSPFQTVCTVLRCTAANDGYVLGLAINKVKHGPG